MSTIYIFIKEKLNPKKIYRIIKANKQIKSLNLFDIEFYLTNYPDVRNSNMNPLDHYIYHGWKEKRVPSTKFDGNYYLKNYSDVRKSEVNPLIHYVFHGKKEGRFPNHHTEINSTENIIKNLKDKLNENNKKHKQEMENLNNKINNLSTSTRKLNETNEKYKQEMENLNNKINNLSTLTRKLNETNEKYKQEMENLNNKINNLSTLTRKLNETNEKYKQEMENLNNKINNLSTLTRKLNETNEKYKQEMENLNNKINNYSTLTRKLNETNEKYKQEMENLNNKINNLSTLTRKYTRVFTINHINKEKKTCEIELFKGLGVTREKRSPQIIVSLTSYPSRIYDIHYCLYSLLNQSFKPDKLILWLSKEEFPNLEEDLPSNLLNLEKHGLEIKWTEKNFRVYNKLIHSLIEYPNDIIVTADDDIFYPEDWLERLYENYDGKNIVAHRAHLMNFESGSPVPYELWEKCIENEEITILNLPTGVGGVLYPPDVFNKDVLKDQLFLKLTPTADDIWFWGMVVLNNRKINVLKNGYKYLTYINPERELNLNDDGTLYEGNKLRNDEQLSAILEYYPEIKDRLLEEIRPKVSVIIPIYNREKYL